MYTKPALGLLFAFLGLIAVSYIGLELFHGDLALEGMTIGMIVVSVLAMIGGGALVASEELKSA